eukprot:scaffold33794_cov112-Isochrysis_galbana.AAC.1
MLGAPLLRTRTPAEQTSSYIKRADAHAATRELTAATDGHSRRATHPRVRLLDRARPLHTAMRMGYFWRDSGLI